MKKIELYLVITSFGQYDDYRECNDSVIYATKEAAEKVKAGIIESYTTPVIGFSTNEFNDCWIETIELDLKSWRERQLDQLI